MIQTYKNEQNALVNWWLVIPLKSSWIEKETKIDFQMVVLSIIQNDRDIAPNTIEKDTGGR